MTIKKDVFVGILLTVFILGLVYAVHALYNYGWSQGIYYGAVQGVLHVVIADADHPPSAETLRRRKILAEEFREGLARKNGWMWADECCAKAQSEGILP